MAIILIAPVATQTKNGYPAEVTGIDLTDPHCLRGTINTYGAVKIAMRWTLSGHCRGAGDGCNLIITTPEMADVVDVAKETVLPSAETAAMLFWALLASGQIVMRKVDGWPSLSQKPSDQIIDLAA